MSLVLGLVLILLVMGWPRPEMLSPCL